MNFLFLIILIPILYYIFSHRKHESIQQALQDPYREAALSPQDAVSQVFILLALFFLGISLLVVGNDLHFGIAWYTYCLIVSLIGLGVAYYFKTVYTLFFSILGIIFWWGYQASEWVHEHNIQSLVIIVWLFLLAIVFYVLGRFYEQQPRMKRFSLFYFTMGLIGITGMLFVFSSKLGISALAEMMKGDLFTNSTPLLLFFFPLLFLAGAGIWYSYTKNIILPAEAAVLTGLGLVFVGLLFSPQLNVVQLTSNSFSTGELTQTGFLLAAVFNIILFLELVGVVLLGFIRHEEWLINLGTRLLFLLLLVKYFDWFFSFLDKSIFFIGAGLFLFGVGWIMEKSRKYMIASMKQK